MRPHLRHAAAGQPRSGAAGLRTAVYAEHWRELALPPSQGEFASGMLPLWMECLLERLRQEPACWEGIGFQMPRKGQITRARWGFLRRLTGLGESQLLELYRDAGIELELRKARGRTHVSQKPPASADGHGGIEEGEAGDEAWEEEEPGAEEGRPLCQRLVQAAALDPVRARFVLAIYCHAPAHLRPPREQ